MNPKRDNGPRRSPRTPAWLCTATSPMTVALVASGRVANIGDSRGCGAYLFIDSERRVYVLSEEQPMAQQWIVSKLNWLVGYYSTAGHRRGVPRLSIDRMAEDVAEHLQSVDAPSSPGTLRVCAG